ncbi:class I SAM-dependent methyltransferase [Candidatus Uhrbacteria bacterium]|nr:class I SAM-dependent methyltransferase [Candidatus Uhrbacteria bacterium]
MSISHDKQKELWEEEHKKPFVLLQMDQKDASSGIQRFFSWLTARNPSTNLAGIEMGCGKGRNSIWLAKQGVKMTAFDFSENAIAEAKKRAKESNVDKKVNFTVQDATKQWHFDDGQFDFAIDCFASTDIESTEGRAFARNEFYRVLKNEGFLLVYTLSTDDEFHKEMLEKHPAEEKNSFTHPTTGKFEKVFDREELLDFYKDFEWVEEQRVEKETEFFEKKYQCKHFWLILKK